MAKSAAATALLSPLKVDFPAAEMQKIIAVRLWMEHCLKQPKLRHPVFRYGQSYSDKDPAMLGYSALKPADITFRINGNTADPDKYDAPTAEDYVLLAKYMAAVNAEVFEDKTRVTTAAPATLEGSAVGATKGYAHIEGVGVPPCTTPAERLDLAIDCERTFTRFRKAGLFDTMENKLAQDAPKELAKIDLAHTYALDMNNGTSNRGIKGTRFLTKAVLMTAGYIFIGPIGGVLHVVFSAAAALGYDPRKLITDPVWTARLRLLGIGTALVDPDFGQTGFKYLAEAGIDVTGFFTWKWPFPFDAADSNGMRAAKVIGNFFAFWPLLAHKIILGIIAVATIIAGWVAESLVRILFWGVKWLGYDSWSVKTQARVDDLQNTLIGLLMVPFIALAQGYRALLNVINVFISPPDQDPSLKYWNDHVWSFLQINTKNPNVLSWAAIIVAKIFHLAFDTLPTLFSRTVVGTLRSVLPAMSSIPWFSTQEKRNAICTNLNTFLYVAAFLFQLALVSWAFLIGVTGGIAASPLAGAMLQMFSGWGAAIQAAATGFWNSVIVAPIVNVSIYIGTTMASFTSPFSMVPGLHVPGSVLTKAVAGSVAGVVAAAGLLVIVANKWEEIKGWFSKKSSQKVMVPDPKKPVVLTELDLKQMGVASTAAPITTQDIHSGMLAKTTTGAAATGASGSASASTSSSASSSLRPTHGQDRGSDE